MKITMIGDSAVGKTTFMMSTYGLMREGIQGFRVKCTDKQADAKLCDAYQLFRKRGIYPSATVQMNRYSYNFYSSGDFVMGFTLTDIRGESIHDIDIQELHRELEDSDAVLLFLSAYDIVNGVDIEDAVNQLHMHLNQAFRLDDRLKLLMPVFTQCDRIDWDENTVETLMEPVADLKRMADRNDNLIFAPVPTACAPDCMMDLDFAMATLMLIGYNREIQTAAQRLKKEVETIERKWGSGLWRDIKHLFGFDPERAEAEKRMKKLQEKELPRYEKMQEKFERVRKFCDDYEIGTTYSVRILEKEDPFDF